jgi:hypothetical protein
MREDEGRQYRSGKNRRLEGPAAVRRGFEAVVPNPKLKLMDQVREVMRLKHYAIRTETCYCDWIRRYIRFHKMKAREELLPGTEKVEVFLSDLAVNGQVAASTQNQAFGAVESGGLRVEGQRVASDFLNAQPSTLNLPAAGGKRDEKPAGFSVGKS